MKIIQDLSSYIDEELGDAQKYIKKALLIKTNCPELADTFYQLSLEEMSHMNRLHNEVEKQIAAFKKTEGEPPEGMQLLYDVLHEKAIEQAKEIRVLQSMYRE